MTLAGSAGPRSGGTEPSSRSGRRALLTSLLVLTALVACGSDPAGTGAPAAAPDSTSTSKAEAAPGADQLETCAAAPSRPPVTNGLPEVSLPCLGQGPDVRLADLRGPLLVNVWAQWCPPCRDEAPYLAELQRKAGGKVRLLGVDYADPRRDQAVAFALSRQLAYPHVVDAEKQLAGPLKIAGPPLTAFVDARGAVTYVHRGPFTSQHQLDQLVRDKLGVAL